METKAIPMINRASTRRTDGYLASILHETANWIVNGPNGKILCQVASLECAVERAVELGALGHRIVAMVRKRDPEIVLFSGQIRKLSDQLFDPDDYLTAFMP